METISGEVERDLVESDGHSSPYFLGPLRLLLYYFHYDSTCMGDAEAHGVGSAGTDDTARTGRAGVCGDNGGAAGEIFCIESGRMDARGSAEAVGEDCQGSADQSGD